MTPRPYTPETREVPLTFLDCPDRSIELINYEPHKALCMNDNVDLFFCENAIKARRCPRHYT